MNLPERRTLRVRLRDLAAASAFTAVGLSGSIPWWVSVLFVTALGSSLLGRRPFAGARAWSVLALLATGAVLFGLAFRGALDLVVAAVAFATLVTAQRMLSDPGTSTDHQVLLASLLLMAGAAALSGDVWYALCLLAFGVFACLTLGLAVVEGPVERDEELPLAPVLQQVSLGVAVALLGGVAFFVLFPRLSWNVAARRSGPGLLGATAGMTDRVRLGGGGDIKTSARVVLRARLEPDPGAETLGRYWVGRRFDRFDGREWVGSGTPGPPAARVYLGENRGRAVVQRIELTPAYGARTLVALEQPVLFGPATAVSATRSTPVALVEVPGEEVHFAEEANAYGYTVASRGDWPVLEDDPARLEALRALPERLDPRVPELAQQIVGARRDPEDVARRLERWLQTNLAYTLELPGEVEDPLADFLFQRKEGHCEHFATALAILLRTRGIPSRVVGGFYGGERLSGRYLVRAGDAHAWVEAYDDTRGWLRFDATPEAGRGGQPQALWARLVGAFEQVEELWRQRVIDYSLVDQWTFVRSLVRPPAGRERDAEAPATSPTRRPPARAALAAVLAGLGVWLAWRRLTRPRVARHPAAVFLDALERRLTAAGVPLAAGEDPEALARRLERQHHALAGPVRHAIRRYLEARFGGRPLSGEERRALLAPLEGRHLGPPGRAPR